MTDSPFINGRQWAWDSTSLGWLKDCPEKYRLSMIEGWRATADSVHLTFGLIYHSSLELYDKLMADVMEVTYTHETALRRVVQFALSETWTDGQPWQSDHSAKNRFSLIRSIVWYLDQFRNDPAKTVILANGQPAVELSFKLDAGFEVSGVPIALTGHLDRIVEFQGFNYVTDRKTTGGTLASYYFENFDLDGQMSQYTIAGQVTLSSPIKGVMIDAAQIAVGFSRFERGFTYRTQAQLEEYLRNVKYWVTQAHELSTLPGPWPLNERSCRLCAFKHVCSKDASVRERFLESDFERRPWNPLEVR